MEVPSNQSLKQALKEALVEVLQERSDLISDAVEDALDDARLLQAMERAHQEGFEDPQKVGALLNLPL
jgi:hypothetical protein